VDVMVFDDVINCGNEYAQNCYCKNFKILDLKNRPEIRSQNEHIFCLYTLHKACIQSS